MARVRLMPEQAQELCYTALQQVGASEEAEVCARVMVAPVYKEVLSWSSKASFPRW
ncbi:MAG TPA: hypothetical protein G4O02_10145 [Caldilineae bacterium]|nr:hypothetical protein [Caldilineae bacterium]